MMALWRFAAFMQDRELHFLHLASQLFVLLQDTSVAVTLLGNLAQDLRVEEVLQALHVLQDLQECSLELFRHIGGVVKCLAKRDWYPLTVIIWLRGLNG